MAEQDKSDFKLSFQSNLDNCEHDDDDDGWCVMIFGDLTLEISECGFPALFRKSVDNINDDNYEFRVVSQQYYDLLNLWHFDTRNLIKVGEAVNVNTLDINPYEYM